MIFLKGQNITHRSTSMWSLYLLPLLRALLVVARDLSCLHTLLMSMYVFVSASTVYAPHRWGLFGPMAFLTHIGSYNTKPTSMASLRPSMHPSTLWRASSSVKDLRPSSPCLSPPITSLPLPLLYWAWPSVSQAPHPSNASPPPSTQWLPQTSLPLSYSYLSLIPQPLYLSTRHPPPSSPSLALSIGCHPWPSPTQPSSSPLLASPPSSMYDPS